MIVKDFGTIVDATQRMGPVSGNELTTEKGKEMILHRFGTIDQVPRLLPCSQTYSPKAIGFFLFGAVTARATKMSLLQGTAAGSTVIHGCRVYGCRVYGRLIGR